MAPIDDFEPPGTGTDLVAVEAEASSVTLSFTEVEDGSGHPALYDLRYSDPPIEGRWEEATVVSEGSCARPLEGQEVGSTLSCTVEGLEPGTPYEFQVAAYRESVQTGSRVYGDLSNAASGVTAGASEDRRITITPGYHAFTALDQETVLLAEAFDAEGEPVASPDLAWSTSDEEVATVDEEGRVIARSVGSAMISVAAVCCAAAQAEVTVEQVVTKVSVAPETASVSADETISFHAAAEDEAGHGADASFAWSSSDTSVAVVGNTGVVRGVGEGRATIRAAAGEASGSAEVSVTIPPPPSAASNEPAGYTSITDRPFDTQVEAGWGDSGSSNFTIVEDRDAPGSCCSVGQARYRAGMSGGTGPVRTWREFGGEGGTELYLSFRVKLSSNWQGHSSSVNKIAFVWIHDNPSVVFSATGVGSSTLRPQIRLQNIPNGAINLSSNVNNVPIQRGQWHHWEVQLISNSGGLSNGVARVWIDGVLVMDHRDVNYAGASESRTWQSFYWNPTWGGVGDTVRSDMYMWMDHVYASGTN